jgi:nitroreductase
MDFIDISKMRTTVRKYSDKKVEPEKLEKILEAGRWAPTAVNYQPPPYSGYARIIFSLSVFSGNAVSGHAIGFMNRPAPIFAASDPATGCR